jgi:hypothetical protein
MAEAKQIPPFVDMIDNSTPNQSASNGSMGKKQKSKTTMHTKVTKKTGQKKRAAKKTENLMQTSAKLSKQLKQIIQNHNGSCSKVQDKEDDLKSPFKLKDENQTNNKNATVDPLPKAKPVAKRVAKLLENINENDILVKVRCDNKAKHTGSTSTPTFRRRPLKLPLDVSLITTQDLE